MSQSNAVSITVYDLTGAPLNPKVVKELERAAEKLAKAENLVYNVATT